MSLGRFKSLSRKVPLLSSSLEGEIIITHIFIINLFINHRASQLMRYPKAKLHIQSVSKGNTHFNWMLLVANKTSCKLPSCKLHQLINWNICSLTILYNWMLLCISLTLKNMLGVPFFFLLLVLSMTSLRTRNKQFSNLYQDDMYIYKC